MRDQLAIALANAFPTTSKLGQQLRLASSRVKQADMGRIFHAVAEPPASLLSAVGKGLSGAGHSAAEMSGQLSHLDPVTRSFAAVPAAIRGGAQGFHEAGGLRAAALTGLGALGVYGAKNLYDEAVTPSVPGYYAPGGY